MNIILKENETMQDLVDRLAASFDLVYDIAPVAYWYENLNENGRIKDIHFSKRMRDMLGYKSVEEFPDELNTLMTFTHPDDVHLMLDDAIRAGTGVIDKYDVQYRIRKADGTYLWCNATGELVKDHNGTTVGMYGGFIDVTKEVQLNEEQETERRIRELISGFSKEYDAAFYGSIPNNTYKKLNNVDAVAEKVEDIVMVDDAMRSYVSNFVHPDDARLFEGEFIDLSVAAKNIAVGQTKTFEYRSRSGGKYAWYKALLRRITETEVLIGFKNCDKEIVSRIVSEKVIGDFASVFVVDLRNDTYRFVSRNSDSGFSDVEGGVYTETIREYISRVNPVYRDFWNMMADLDKVRELLTENSRLEYVYPLEHAERRWRRCVSERLDSENGVPTSFVMTYFALDDTSAENMELLAQIAEQKEKLEEVNIRDQMLYDISNAIKWSYEIGADGRIVSYSYADKGKEIVRSDNFEGNPMAWVDQVHPDDKEAAVKAFEAAIHDHSGVTKYDSTYRIMGTNGKYVWLKVAGRMHRREDGTGEMFGVSLDITDQMEEQQKHLLGAMPLSNDVLEKANIGLWAFELDEGQPPRMYDDETMLGLVGLDHPVPPEEAYHAWYDHIDEGSYDLVTDAVAKMSAGTHAEVQYPWHFPDGRTIIVRCGGVRNFEYTKGIRIEGTHQDVTRTLHFDEEERARAKQMENDLIISKLRADSLAYISDNEPDLDNALNFFGKKILEISGCDQVVYRELNGRKLVLNAPGSEDVPETICSQCPFARFDCEAFKENGFVLMDDCSLGYRGMMTPADCPARSSFMQMVYSGGDLVGKLTVHYLKDLHSFQENELNILKTVAIYLGILIGRIKEKQAEIARIEAESSNKAKTEFLFNMSHDIRTPMNAILGYTDIALNHIDERERVNDSLRKIKTSGGHLLRLINDILEMSRIEAGRLEISNSPLNIYEVSEGVINMTRALAATKDINFYAKIDDLKDPYIYADELHINQVIINLISNAIKYTRPGGTVEYNIEQISDPIDSVAKYRVTVKDNGIGMSEEFQRHLFESFSREQTPTVSRQEGAGLGLAIVKRIVDLTGGTISVRSKQGEGSVFTVELPMRVMDEAEIAAYEASRHADTDIREDISLTGKRVLIVEDNEMNREIAVEILEEIGLIVESAEDGELAVRKVMENGADRYDFILMDIQMPVMNGYEATAEIRKLDGGDKVPIIALSANAFAEDKAASLAAGMDAHVAKPINIKELIGVMAKFI